MSYRFLSRIIDNTTRPQPKYIFICKKTECNTYLKKFYCFICIYKCQRENSVLYNVLYKANQNEILGLLFFFAIKTKYYVNN